MLNWLALTDVSRVRCENRHNGRDLPEMIVATVMIVAAARENPLCPLYRLCRLCPKEQP